MEMFIFLLHCIVLKGLGLYGFVIVVVVIQFWRAFKKKQTCQIVLPWHLNTVDINPSHNYTRSVVPNL